MNLLFNFAGLCIIAHANVLSSTSGHKYRHGEIKQGRHSPPCYHGVPSYGLGAITHIENFVYLFTQ